MNIPLPQWLTQQIADQAVRNARNYGAAKGWKSVSKLKPHANDGIAGIIDPTNHLKFVDKGIEPFLMHWVEGRVVGIPGKHTNKTYFVRGKEVGQPGYVTIPAGENVRRQSGQSYPIGSVNRDGSLRVWRNQKWRHPGIKPTNFLQNSIDDAKKQYRDDILKYAKKVLGGGEQ